MRSRPSSLLIQSSTSAISLLHNLSHPPLFSLRSLSLFLSVCVCVCCFKVALYSPCSTSNLLSVPTGTRRPPAISIQLAVGARQAARAVAPQAVAAGALQAVAAGAPQVVAAGALQAVAAEASQAAAPEALPAVARPAPASLPASRGNSRPFYWYMCLLLHPLPSPQLL
jgi:hypothetical protein